jgi:hypothetical protein
VRRVPGLLLLLATLALLASAPLRAAEDRGTKVRKDREAVGETGLWIYNDLERALSEGAHTGKPLLVVLRCVP